MKQQINSWTILMIILINQKLIKITLNIPIWNLSAEKSFFVLKKISNKLFKKI